MHETGSDRVHADPVDAMLTCHGSRKVDDGCLRRRVEEVGMATVEAVIDAMLMMEPPPDFFISGTAKRVIMTIDLRLIFMPRSHSSRSSSTAFPRTRLVPTLFTRMSSLPHCLTVRCPDSRDLNCPLTGFRHGIGRSVRSLHDVQRPSFRSVSWYAFAGILLMD